MNIERIEKIIEECSVENTVVSEVTEPYDKIFGSFYHTTALYFIKQASERFKKNSGCYLIENEHDILRSCAAALVEDIIQAVISTLIIELYQRKDEGIYPSYDIYCDFCDDLKDPDTLLKLARKYPCMFSLMYEASERRADLIASCIENIAQNKSAIEKTVGFGFDHITDIHVTNGDSHNGGKKVIIIVSDNGKFVYKPHSLKPEKLFEDIISDIMELKSLKYDLKTAAVCSFDDFGVQEFITQKSINSEKEAERYFYRIGAFSAVFDSITCDDLHHENMICSGEYPYFVDLETLIKNPVDRKAAFEKRGFLGQAMNALNDSVLGTMLFPFNTNLSFFDIDVSGITGSSREKSSKWKSFELTNAGTDRIRFIPTDGHMEDADNLLMCGEKEVSPICFTEEIIEGYTDAANTIRKHSSRIIERIRKSNAVIRRVLRPTAFYGKMLKVSYAPKYYGSEDERQKLFAKLFKGYENNDKERRRVNYEIEALLRNDIPLFSQNIHSRDLIADGITAVEEYTDILPGDKVAEKISEMDDAYIRKQISYIRMSICTNHRKDDDREDFGRSFPNEKLSLGSDPLKAAEIIAEHIYDTMIYSLDGKSAAWYTVSPGDRYTLEIGDTKMYEGGGIPLFMLALWKCTGNLKWLDTAERSLNGLDELGFIKHIDDSSMFLGTAGVMYIFYCFYAFTGDEIYREKLEAYAAKVIEKMPELEFGPDIINGFAGSVIALTGICRNIHSPAINEILAANAERLAEAAEKNELPEMTGFAHGYAGIALALATYGEYTGNRHFTELAEDLIEKENVHTSPDMENWLDLRKAEGHEGMKSYGEYWCHGAPGIALSRLLMKDIIQKDVSRDIEWGRKCIVEQSFSDIIDHSLCHGAFGNIDMMITFGKVLGDRSLIETACNAALKYMKDIENSGFRSGIADMPAIPSFMTGITGIGYELLRVYDNSLPSVNSIEVPEIRRNNIGS